MLSTPSLSQDTFNHATAPTLFMHTTDGLLLIPPTSSGFHTLVNRSPLIVPITAVHLTPAALETSVGSHSQHGNAGVCLSLSLHEYM